MDFCDNLLGGPEFIARQLILLVSVTQSVYGGTARPVHFLKFPFYFIFNDADHHAASG